MIRFTLLNSFVSLCAVVILCAGSEISAKDSYVLDQARVAEIAASLPQQPRGPGEPITDRAFWGTIAQEPAMKAQVAAARKLKSQPLPALTDELFLEFSRNGNRRNYENVAFNRRNRLAPLVLAECIENKGEFLPDIDSLISELCKSRTWVLPAHDKQLTNFRGTTITIDLFSSALAWDLSMADYLLGAKLQPQVRATLRQEVMRRVVMPFQAMIHNEQPDIYWMTGSNNWNAVCFSGVTGAGLIELESAKDRAELIAAAEHYSKYFLDGFGSDGYCSEGMGYWNYGYGRFAIMAQNFRLQTGGKVDFFAMKGAAAPASYGPRAEIINGVYPAFADCSLAAKPNPALLWLLNGVYGWGNEDYGKDAGTPHTTRSLFEAMLYHSPKVHPAAPIKGVDISGANGIRTVFHDADVYICRPKPGSELNFGVAFKGGNNDEHHNHNDLGSYVVVIGNEPVLLDPGPETYTKRTFSKKRYDSKLLNSFGHAVPVVAGELQGKGKRARAKLLNVDFNDTTDTVTLNLRSAYKVPGLKKLTRTFEYRRTGDGVFVITDHVEFERPEQFETAMISLGTFYAGTTPGEVVVLSGKTKARVKIESTQAYETGSDQIVENAPVKPNRLRIRLTEPVSSATVRMMVTPADAEE